MTPREPTRGDLVEVAWVDIYEDPTGNPDGAKLLRRTSYAVFWDRVSDGVVPCIVTTSTVDPRGPENQGYCIYPAACVLSLKVIKPARRSRKTRVVAPEPVA